MTENTILLNLCKLYVEPYIKDAFIVQGHELTADWEESIMSQEAEDGVEIMARGYGMIVDAGVTPERIPFGGVGTGNGGELSQYILGLVRFWQLRKPGISAKAALKLAFATANVQKREGMSTIASEEFSATGKRQHFMDTLENLFRDYMDNAVFEGFEVLIDEQAASPKIMYIG